VPKISKELALELKREDEELASKDTVVSGDTALSIPTVLILNMSLVPLKPPQTVQYSTRKNT
jgi:hypothetical protein